MRNDGHQPPALLTLYHLAHLCPPARKPKGVGVDSHRTHLHIGRNGHSGLLGVHLLGIAVGDYPAARRMRRCGDYDSPTDRDSDLEITVTTLLITVWLLFAVSASILVLAWIAEVIGMVRDSRNRH